MAIWRAQASCLSCADFSHLTSTMAEFFLFAQTQMGANIFFDIKIRPQDLRPVPSKLAEKLVDHVFGAEAAVGLRTDFVVASLNVLFLILLNHVFERVFHPR